MSEPMSDAEKYEAQGRAHAALKTAQSNVATLTLALREYANSLRQMYKVVEAFVVDPAPLTTPFRPMAEISDIQEGLRQLNTDRAIVQLEELREETLKVRHLKEQIERF